MAWYYYTGKAVQSVQVKAGLSLAVKPHSKVEIIDMNQTTQVLINKGLLRRTGKPKGAVSVKDTPVPTEKLADVMPKSDLAMIVAEKGATSSPHIAPTSKNVEVTEAEKMAAVAKKISEQGNATPDEVSKDDEESDEEAAVEVEKADDELSEVEGSGQGKRKKRKRRQG